jgi:peroxiredoxin
MDTRLDTNTAAPDFRLVDTNGDPVQLSDFRGNKHVVLVFNRGFA